MNLIKKSLIVKALIIALLSVFLIKGQTQGTDYQILKNLSTHRSPSDTRFNHFITNTAPYLTVGTPILMYGIGLIEHDATLQKKSLEIGVAVAATVVETYALKYIVKRPRPYITHPDINAVDTEGSYSFPSGHTSGAFALATSLSLNYPKWYVIVPSFAWAGLTGYSRMYLGVHYPSDVLTGAVIGSGTAWLTWKANKAWQKRMGKKG